MSQIISGTRVARVTRMDLCVCIQVGSSSSQGQAFGDGRVMLVIRNFEWEWEGILKDFMVGIPYFL